MDDPLRKILEDLHDELAHVRPARAASVDPHDPDRLEEIIAALQDAAPPGYRFFVNAAGSFGFWRRR